MKLTLLEYVQMILSSLNSQQVNSISDTVESVQVAHNVKTAYLELLGRFNLPEHNELVQLVASNNAVQPTVMYRPEGVTRINFIRYFDSNPNDSLQQDQYGSYSHDLNTDLENTISWNTTSATENTIGLGSITFTVPSGLSINPGDAATAYNGANSMSGTVTSYNSTTLILNITSITGTGTFSSWAIINASGLQPVPGYKEVHLITVDEFIRRQAMFDSTAANVGTYTLDMTNNDSGLQQAFTFYYVNNKQPQFCCIIENEVILFDSFDNTQDTTLQSAKTMADAWVYPTWTMSDSFIPNLQDQQVPLLLNEAKALAFNELKQMPNQKAEREVQQQIASLQKWQSVSNRPTYFDEIPDFGRRGGGWY